VGALDGVHAISVPGPLGAATGAMTGRDPVGDTANPPTSAVGIAVATTTQVGNEGEKGVPGATVEHPGDSRDRDVAWMPPLTELPDRAFQYQIELRVDQETGRVVARVIDRESGEVVRQVPPEYVLQLAMYIDEWLGRVLDARA